jgi:uncharacterized protein
MSPMKGVRKTRNARPAGIRLGKYVIPPPVAVAGLLTVMYAWLVFGNLYGIGDPVMQVVYFAIIAAVAFYLAVVQKAYKPLSFAFIAIAVPLLFWDLAGAAGYGPLSASGAWIPDVSWVALTGILNLLVAAVLAGALLYYEKGRLSDIYVQSGDLKEGLLIGGGVLALSFIIAVVLCLMRTGYTGSNLGVEIISLIVFSLASGIAGELLFRGLLLSRLIRIAGPVPALALQAVAFAAFEAAFFYMVIRSVPPAAAVFVIALVLGLFWGWLTVREKSIIVAALSHAGIYMIIGLFMFAIVSL